MLNKFDEYQLDLLVESVKNQETKLFFSGRLLSIIKYMSYDKDNNIANYMLINYNNPDYKVKITYIDLDRSGFDKVSYITVPKAVEVISKLNPERHENREIEISTFSYYDSDDSDVYKKHRVITTVGRLIRKLYEDKFSDKDIESFVNIFKSARDNGKFELVKGDDIVHWYSGKNYTSGGGKLNNSCMRYDDAQGYVKFYAVNSGVCSMLILKDKDDDEKIKGRALVWKLSEPEGRYFMDRIYTVLDSDVELFKDYARNQKWLYKSEQSINEFEDIVDTIDDTDERRELVVNGVINYHKYPYVDTLKFYSYDQEELTNDSDRFSDERHYYLEETDGGKEVKNGYIDDDDDEEDDHNGEIWVESDGEWYSEDDVYFCDRCSDARHTSDMMYSEHYGQSICDDCQDDMISCDYYIDGDNYRDPSDAIELDKYDEHATQEYLDSSRNIFVWSEESNNWLKNDDAVWSDHYNDYLDTDDAVEVYTDDSDNLTDWRIDGDGTYFEKDGELYDNDVEFPEEEDEEWDSEEEEEEEKPKKKLKNTKKGDK